MSYDTVVIWYIPHSKMSRDFKVGIRIVNAWDILRITWAKSFISMKADLCQDINRGFVF